MNSRTIMIFPEIENIKVVDEIREKYDPLAKLVRPHITLVFPFKDEMENEKLVEILTKRLDGIKPFAIKLHGFSTSKDRFGNFLFLDVLVGKDKITKIHNLLYDNEFSKYDLSLDYLPHMTIGKFDSVQELELAYNEVTKIETSFSTTVNKISIEMIGDNEESIIIFEKILK